MLKAIAEYAKHDRSEFDRVVQEAQSSQQTAEGRKQFGLVSYLTKAAVELFTDFVV